MTKSPHKAMFNCINLCYILYETTADARVTAAALCCLRIKGAKHGYQQISVARCAIDTIL
jgi:hypothetical protein